MCRSVIQVWVCIGNIIKTNKKAVLSQGKPRDATINPHGIASANSLESHLEVIQGHSFEHQPTDLTYLLLPHFRDIAAFVRRGPLFLYPTPISANRSWCSFWSRLMGPDYSKGLRLISRGIIFEAFQPV